MSNQKYLVALTNQGEGRIDVHDLSLGTLDETSRIWSQPYSHPCSAGVKLRRYKGRLVVLASFGHTNASMVDYETHEVIWHTEYTGVNPHSIELIPFDGDRYLICVAASVGFDVKFFDPERDGDYSVGCVYAPDGHGVLYDPDEKCLWVLSKNILSKNEVKWEDGEVSVTRLAKYIAPFNGGHDMAPVYGDKNRLWVTFHRTVYQFDKKEEKFRTDYDTYSLIHSEERNGQVKGVGNFHDGTCVKIYPDGEYYQWTSKTVRLIKKNEDGGYEKTAITSPTGHYYKVRVFCEDYN